jgi:phenolic acid decarboxylase
MKYTIETTENGVNETLELNGTIYKKEWLRRENGLLECSQKDFRAYMEEDGYSGELIAKVDGIFDGFLADAVDEMREYLG